MLDIKYILLIFAALNKSSMNQKHTSQDVAQTIKNLFKQSGKQLNDFARDNGVTPTQLYAVLSGDKYINAAWAIKFNMEVGVEIMYCMFGDMPIMDSKHEFDKLLFAVTSYKEAVEAEDKLRDEFELNQESLSPAEKAACVRAIAEARKNKMKESAELAVLLKKGWNEDGDEEEPQTINTPKPMSELKLHEAIEMVIKEAGRPLTFTEIAKQINARNLYSRQDRTPVPASQISARVKNYPSWFTVNRDESPATVSIAKQ